MPLNNELLTQVGFDSTDHQSSYVFTPANFDTEQQRPRKRRKILKPRLFNNDGNLSTIDENLFKFPSLLNGVEKPEFVELRQHLFEVSWTCTKAEVEAIINAANATTLAEVTSFVDETLPLEHTEKIPTGLIVTGPNIVSQELLFSQLADRLKFNTDARVVVLRSGDAINLKAVLKKLIRDATNQKYGEDDAQKPQQDGCKLLNYDLQILQDHLKSNKSCKINKIVVAFQDSEGLDNALLAELIVLFSSWLDRIPFALLFGVATSVELFQERLPRRVANFLNCSQFDVEQTSKTLHKVFQSVIAGLNAPLRLGSGFVTALLERQRDQVQSVEAFVSALKYAYMCHFYANPLSIFLSRPEDIPAVLKNLQPEHLEAIRVLPSFRKTIEAYLEDSRVDQVRILLESDEALIDGIQTTLEMRRQIVTNRLRTIHILNEASCLLGLGPIDQMDVYVKAFSGQLDDSDLVKDVLEALKHITSDGLIALTGVLMAGIDYEGSPNGWPGGDVDFLRNIAQIRAQVKSLRKSAEVEVVAQKVQLSKEESTLSRLDISYTVAVDGLTDLLKDYFKCGNPQDMFLNEAWLYDAKSPYREAFTPRPRYAVERALSFPHDYLGCACCKASKEGLFSLQPPTAILYQLYLETGSLINVIDLWSAFFAIVGGEDGEDCDERNALVLFYRALADLKILGMVKQSRKKTDHLAKLAWKGL